MKPILHVGVVAILVGFRVWASAVSNVTVEPEPEFVAFHARLTSTLQNLGNNQIIRFNTVTTNEGEAYDKTNGIFTCLREGLYIFHYSVMTYTGKTTFVCLALDGVCTGAISYGSIGQNYESASNAVILRLTLGQQVWLENKSAAYNVYTYNSGSGSGTTFSGYLISD